MSSIPLHLSTDMIAAPPRGVDEVVTEEAFVTCLCLSWRLCSDTVTCGDDSPCHQMMDGLWIGTPGIVWQNRPVINPILPPIRRPNSNQDLGRSASQHWLDDGQRLRRWPTSSQCWFCNYGSLLSQCRWCWPSCEWALLSRWRTVHGILTWLTIWMKQMAEDWRFPQNSGDPNQLVRRLSPRWKKLEKSGKINR